MNPRLVLSMCLLALAGCGRPPSETSTPSSDDLTQLIGPRRTFVETRDAAFRNAPMEGGAVGNVKVVEGTPHWRFFCMPSGNPDWPADYDGIVADPLGRALPAGPRVHCGKETVLYTGPEKQHVILDGTVELLPLASIQQLVAAAPQKRYQIAVTVEGSGVARKGADGRASISTWLAFECGYHGAAWNSQDFTHYGDDGAWVASSATVLRQGFDLSVCDRPLSLATLLMGDDAIQFSRFTAQILEEVP